jgi:hypothetical protein
VNVINRNKKEYKSILQMLTAFFTPNNDNNKNDTVAHLPHSEASFYKFNIDDTVKINVMPAQRKNLGFKYSLNIGKLANFLNLDSTLLTPNVFSPFPHYILFYSRQTSTQE